MKKEEVIGFCSSFAVMLVMVGLIIGLSNKINAFQLLGMLIAPMVFHCGSVLAAGRSCRRNSFAIATVYSVVNFAEMVIVGLYIKLFGKMGTIYAKSQAGNMEYISVSKDRSPIFSGMIFLIVFFVLYYILSEKVKKPTNHTLGES
jgi:hypothetical protein